MTFPKPHKVLVEEHESLMTDKPPNPSSLRKEVSSLFSASPAGAPGLLQTVMEEPRSLPSGGCTSPATSESASRRQEGSLVLQTFAHILLSEFCPTITPRLKGSWGMSSCCAPRKERNGLVSSAARNLEFESGNVGLQTLLELRLVALQDNLPLPELGFFSLGLVSSYS